MADPLRELSQIAQKMVELETQAREIELPKVLDELENSASEVGNSWSGSWFGYQANVYYSYLQPPEKNAFFDKERGLDRQWEAHNRTSGSWMECDPDQVINEIQRRAGNLDMKPAMDFRAKARRQFQREKMNLLSIIDIELSHSPSQFLSEIREDLTKLTTPTGLDLLEDWIPQPPYETYDLRARQGGLKAPPHLRVLSRVRSIRNTLTSVISLAEVARHTEAHISRRRADLPPALTGNKVFIGHGRSLIWRELKDFVEDQLGLPVDEFNRIPSAGVSITDRLSEMMDSSVAAFLIMTGEDEQPTGELRPRENVVHEAGLFQGRVGFKRAIVLLENGCEKFSNNAGLVHINFPMGNIRAAFQDVREVLEREGLLNG